MKTAIFGNLFSIASSFGGVLKIDTEASVKAIQISLTFSSSANLPEFPLRIQCHQPLLQTGFTQLAYQAGLKVGANDDSTPLLTDRASLIETSDRIIWVNQNSKVIPEGVKAKVDLTITSSQLREVVATVIGGENWGLDKPVKPQPTLSHREREVIALLAQGLRDRDIAEQLYISDSTVKFHINNILFKLSAKTRLQALYSLMSTDRLEL